MQILLKLEDLDWRGTYEAGTPMQWNGQTLSGMGHDVMESFVAGDLSLIHVYYKDLNVVEYIREENFGTMDLIGSRCTVLLMVLSA